MVKLARVVLDGSLESSYMIPLDLATVLHQKGELQLSLWSTHEQPEYYPVKEGTKPGWDVRVDV